MGRDLSPQIVVDFHVLFPRNWERGPDGVRFEPHPLAITCNTISNRADGCHGQTDGLAEPWAAS